METAQQNAPTLKKYDPNDHEFHTKKFAENEIVLGQIFSFLDDISLIKTKRVSKPFGKVAAIILGMFLTFIKV